MEKSIIIPMKEYEKTEKQLTTLKEFVNSKNSILLKKITNKSVIFKNLIEM